MSSKVNRKAPTEAQKKKKDPLAKKRNAAKILALILAVVMVLGMVLPALLWLGERDSVKDRVKWETDQEEAQYEKQQKNERPAGDAYRIRILLSGRTSQSG